LNLLPTREESIGDCRLILGDCREVLPILQVIDATVTDPPYGVSLGSSKDRRPDHVLVKDGYASYVDSPKNFREIIVPAINAALGLSARGMVFIAGKSAWMLPRPDAIGGVFLPAACGRNQWGFNSLSICLLYGKAPELQRGSRPTAMRSTEAAEKNGHPCPKPLSWMTWAVELASRPGHTVLDPFMGSGTTGVACARLGRRFIGVEIEPGYFDIACRRIEEATRQADVLRRAA
jgi:site-specific DNA-methyltransferase (adenine-specific)